jgi:hypothetical protein
MVEKVEEHYKVKLPYYTAKVIMMILKEEFMIIFLDRQLYLEKIWRKIGFGNFIEKVLFQE